ncbi:MAG: ABC transporter ATP-binding protein, partial [Anaerolineales bacterium]|nr:ABC transporter ATP-binding protein [Anaerolineales bacterium]
MTRSEFTVADAHTYDHRSTLRWLQSHILRYKGLLLTFLLTTIGMASAQSMTAVTVGWAFDSIIQNEGRAGLTAAALYVVAAYVGYGLFDIVNSLAIRVLAQRVERNARDELYLSLLSKSQTFHGQQRVGDLMARATNDVQQIGLFVSPALGTTTESVLTLLVPLVTITTLDYRLLVVPIVFLITTYFALRRYNDNLAPVATQLRGTFAEMNAGLAETISGIEVVKGFAQETAENARFSHNAGAYRDAFVREGEVTARYLPLLLYGLTIGLGFGHALYLFMQDVISVGQVITFMALLGTLRSPVRFLLRNIATFQQSFASARRILEMILTETELDQNEAGVAQEMKGEVVFDGVDFGYGEASSKFASGKLASGESSLVLQNISFTARPGQTVAIVGQTGAGKSTLTRLLNRTFDVVNGRILIDNIDVRAWSLDSLRGQIGTIEQDIFLFSRTIAENIAFGAPADVPQAEIEAAAKQAQAHDFIMGFPNGYQTKIGERGVMLSGGQRQR